MTRPFTGRHMLAVMVLFFGTVVAVNLTMAYFASRTFGGTTVDNSYVASQKYNDWLAAARAQDALGLKADVSAGAARKVVAVLTKSGAPFSGAAVTAVAEHPLGRAPDTPLRFAEIEPGVYQALQPLPAGRWYVAVTATADGATLRARAAL
jgi:nitrogen fixation protein FixH